MPNLSAAMQARQTAALDKLYRDRATGRIYSLRTALAEGEYAYRRAEHDRATGRTEYGLVSAQDAAAMLARSEDFAGELYAQFGAPRALAVEHAQYTVTPKLVADFAESLPWLRIERDGYSRVSTEVEITDAEWAQLTGGAS